MKKDELEHHLLKLGVLSSQIQWRNNSQLQIPCPLAFRFHKKSTDSNPSLSIKYSDTEPTVWKCFSCLESGKLWELFDSVGSLRNDKNLIEHATKLIDSDKPTLSSKLAVAFSSIDDYFLPSQERKIVELDKTILNNYPYAWDQWSGRQYLELREVSEDTATFWNLRYDKRLERIMFPVHTQENKLVGAVGRTLNNDPKRYYNYFGFSASSSLGGIHTFDPSRNSVLVLEGFFDLLRVYQWAWNAGHDVCCTWHSEISDYQMNLLLSVDKQILICYDMDEAGNNGARKAIEKYHNFTSGMRRLTWTGLEDMGEIDEIKFLDTVSKSKIKIPVSLW